MRAASPPCSSQDTVAPAPSSSIASDVKPYEWPVLTRTGLLKVAPASPEKATCTRGGSCAPVYQETATLSPFAPAEAALTGQASIFHLSGLRIFDGDHLPPSNRMMAISRMSSVV